MEEKKRCEDVYFWGEGRGGGAILGHQLWGVGGRVYSGNVASRFEGLIAKINSVCWQQIGRREASKATAEDLFEQEKN